jgi:Putative zinc-finger
MMSESKDRFADHREAWELISWVVNGSATAAQCAQVQAHVAGCADCAHEMQIQSQLQAAIRRAPAPSGDAASSFLKLSARFDEAPVPALPRRPRWAVFGGKSALLALVAVEAVGLIALGGALWGRSSMPAAPVYRTLGVAIERTPQATIRAVFDPALPLGNLQTLLGQLRLQIVDGPSATGVFSLGPAWGAPGMSTAQAVSALHSLSSVRFAEPAGGAVDPR